MLSPVELDWITQRRRQRSINDKSFKVAIPLRNDKVVRAARALRRADPKSFSRDIVDAAFFVATQEGIDRDTPLVPHYYYGPVTLPWKARLYDFVARIAAWARYLPTSAFFHNAQVTKKSTMRPCRRGTDDPPAAFLYFFGPN